MKNNTVITLPPLHHDDTIKMDSNPSYESQGSNITLQHDPSYGVNKLNRKLPEYEHDYAQPTEFTKHPSQNNRGDDINMESNPSYGVTRRGGNSYMGYDVTIAPNPSYGVARNMGTNIKTTPGSNVTTTLV